MLEDDVEVELPVSVGVDSVEGGVLTCVTMTVVGSCDDAPLLTGAVTTDVINCVVGGIEVGAVAVDVATVGVEEVAERVSDVDVRGVDCPLVVGEVTVREERLEDDIVDKQWRGKGTAETGYMLTRCGRVGHDANIVAKSMAIDGLGLECRVGRVRGSRLTGAMVPRDSYRKRKESGM